MPIRIKTPQQIENIRKSCHLARRTLKHIAQYVQEGVTTEFINKKVEEYLRENNATAATLGYKGYPAASCISVNDVICHGVPNSYALRNGDIVNVDVTTILNGYFGDTCLMYTVGDISKDAQDILNITKACLDLGIAECRPDNRFGNIGYRIGKYAQAHGYGVVYQFCGHGVGLEFHEEPEVNFTADKNSGARMKPGMIFTVEPMINQGKARSKIDKKDKWTARTIDGKLSAQYEHTVLITDTGVDVLTDLDGEYDHLKINR